MITVKSIDIYNSKITYAAHVASLDSEKGWQDPFGGEFTNDQKAILDSVLKGSRRERVRFSTTQEYNDLFVVVTV